MKCIIKKYKELNIDELYDILQLRSDVFVLEQTCLYRDMDSIDKKSIHIYIYENEIVAYARIYEKNTCTLQIGRVVSKYRGKGYGMEVMRQALNICKSMEYKKVYIEAQEYAIDFYKKHGFHVISKPFLEDGIPHVQMEKEL